MRAEAGLPPKPRKGEVLPFPDLMWAWVGFWRLSNSRPQGMGGPLRIPFSEVVSYCAFMKFDFVKSQDFLIYAERMDNSFMTYIVEEQDKARNKTGASGTPPAPKVIKK